MITLYHNNKCSKCREVLEILKNSKKEFEVVVYLETPPSAELLESLLNQLKLEPEQIVRTGEDEYEILATSGSLPKSRTDWIALMVKYPVLIERPIVSNGMTAVVGRPPSKVSEWLANFDDYKSSLNIITHNLKIIL